MGLGYIGLPTAALLATNGYEVIGIDINERIVDEINRAKAHIVEPGLDFLIQKAVGLGKLSAKTQLTGNLDDVHVYLIAVPTPITEDKKPDVSYVYSAVRSMASHLKKGDLIILESTSPVSTTSEIALLLQELRPDLSVPVENGLKSYDIHIAYCPERVLPGKTLHELIHNDRIIGGLTLGCAEKAASFYRGFVKGTCFTTRAKVAALCKLTENAFRDVNIAFSNELSMICDALEVDVGEVRELSNRHPRVHILKPGTGVGGHCLAVDPWFIVDSVPNFSRLIKTARQINDAKPNYLVSKIKKILKEINNPRILCLGLSYKPDIDDLRESPAVEVVKGLAQNTTYQIDVVEPHVCSLPDCLLAYKNINLVTMDRRKEYDYCVTLVEHTAFKGALSSIMKKHDEAENTEQFLLKEIMA
jgi:UDP-N-acetyl-D-mannosaminuronic acid dehydrogenase